MAGLDPVLDRSDRSRWAICARVLALGDPVELPLRELWGLDAGAVKLVPVRAADEPLCVVPDEPPHAASVELASTKAEAHAATRPEISILRITFLCYLFAAIEERRFLDGRTSTGVSRRS